jgi:hypothetical protein
LPTNVINLQKQPKDAHKSPPKTFLGKSKFSQLLQLNSSFSRCALQALHCKLTDTLGLCYSLDINIIWFNVSTSNPKMSFIKKLELYTWSWGRRKFNNHLALHYSSIYDLWPTYIIHGKMWWNQSLKTPLDSLVGYYQEATWTKLCFHKFFLHKQNNVKKVKVKTKDQKFNFLIGGKNNSTRIKLWFHLPLCFIIENS